MSIRLEHTNNGSWITFDRAERRNALDEGMFDRLIAALEVTAALDGGKYLVISGIGKDFCAGGDVREFDKMLQADGETRRQTTMRQFEKLSKRLFDAVQSVRQPIVVAARGNAIGAGAQLLFAADLVIASVTLKIALPQVKLAHSLDHGESFSLTRKIGLAKAMEIALLGDPLDAAAADRAGLINWLVADPELEERTRALADRLARSPLRSLRGNKALLLSGAHVGLAGASEQLEREGAVLTHCVSSPDFDEAIDAFAQKRAPAFQGN